MNPIHNINVRVIEKDENKIPSIIKKLTQLIPIDFKKEKIDINHEKTKGFEDKTIHILTMDTKKTKHNDLLIDNSIRKLNISDKKQLYDQINTRLDEEGNFYIRLDKNSLLNDKHILVDHGDCFHFRIKIAAFPKNKETIKKSTEKFLEKTCCIKEKKL